MREQRRQDGRDERVHDQATEQPRRNVVLVAQDAGDDQREHQRRQHRHGHLQGRPQGLLERQAPVQRDRQEADGDRADDHQQARDERVHREIVALELDSGVEEIEGHQQRGQCFDRVQHVVGLHGRHVGTEVLRDHADDESADEIVDAQVPGDQRAGGRYDHEEGEIALGRIRQDDAGKSREHQRQYQDHGHQHQGAEGQGLDAL